MLTLETVVKIRVDHFQDQVPIKVIVRKRRVSRDTSGKAVRKGPKTFGSAGMREPKLGRWTGGLRGCLRTS